MGFITESQTRTDYINLYSEMVKNTKYSIQVWLTPQGLLIEVVEQTMDSQSVNEEVIKSFIINTELIMKSVLNKQNNTGE